MHTWFFVSSFVCLAASIEKLYTFDSRDTILAECIERQLVKVDDQFNLTEVANKTAHLASRRFNGKTMWSIIFNRRFNDFIYGLRNGKLINDLEKDELSEQLRVALKEALTACANITVMDEEKSKKSTSQSEEKILSFDKKKGFLSRCIQSHLKLTGRREFQLNNGLTEFIADSAAQRFHGKSLSRKDFCRRHKYFFYFLRKIRKTHNMTNDDLSSELELTIRQAVEDCAVDKYPLVAVPTFENEPPEIAHILDLILVRWPQDLYHMIQTKNDRAILRRYAMDNWAALVRELKICQYDTQIFRLALRSFWNNKAQRFYDGNSAELPYMVHHYTLNYPIPHIVQSDFVNFNNRDTINFNERNPKISESHLNEILSIHKPDRPNSNGDIDIYYNYNRNGMISSEYYFENQINQFYRIIFFFMELQARGIRSDDDDIFDEALPHDLVPELIQAIVYDDDVYGNYLMNQRLSYKRLLDSSYTQNDVYQNFLKNARVLEENLILLMSNIPTASGIQSKSQSATTVRITSTTMQSLKRKDDVWKNEYGKCFSKRAKTTTILNSTSTSENFHMQDRDEAKSSIFQENFNCFVSDFSVEDSSMCFFDEFAASVKREKNESDNFYGYVFSNNDSK